MSDDRYPSPYPSYVRSYVPLPIQLIQGTAQETTQRYDQGSEGLDAIRRALQTATVADPDRAAWEQRVAGVRDRIQTLSQDGILSNKLSQVRGIARDLEGEYGQFQRNQAQIQAERERLQALEVSGGLRARMQAAQFSGYQGLQGPDGQLNNFFSPRYQFSNEADLSAIALEAVKPLEDEARAGGGSDLGGGLYGVSSTTSLSPERVASAARLAIQNSPEARGQLQNEYYLFKAENPNATEEEAQAHVQGIVDEVVQTTAATYSYTNETVDVRNLPSVDENGNPRSRSSSSSGLGPLEMDGLLLQQSPAFVIPQGAITFEGTSQELNDARTTFFREARNARAALEADGFTVRTHGENPISSNSTWGFDIIDRNGNRVEDHPLYDQIDLHQRRAVRLRETWEAATQSVLPQLRQRFNDPTLSVAADGQLVTSQSNRNEGQTVSMGTGAPGVRVDTVRRGVPTAARREYERMMEQELRRLSPQRNPTSNQMVHLPTAGEAGKPFIEHFSRASGIQLYNASGNDSQGGGNELGGEATHEFTTDEGVLKPGFRIVPIGYNYTDNGRMVEAMVEERDGNQWVQRRRVMAMGDSVNDFVDWAFGENPQAALYITAQERLAHDLQGRDETARFNSGDPMTRMLNNLQGPDGNSVPTDALENFRIRRGQSGYFLEAEFKNGQEFEQSYGSLSQLIQQGMPELTQRIARIANVDTSPRGQVNFDLSGGSSRPNRGQVSPQQTAQGANPRAMVEAARSVGLQGEQLETALAIALAESSGNPRAHNPVGADNSYGLWQINMLGGMGPERRQQFGLQSNEELWDPIKNARAMFAISNGGRNWRPWTTYTSGKYRQYLDQARRLLNS